jgi:hypothetical protein
MSALSRVRLWLRDSLDRSRVERRMDAAGRLDPGPQGFATRSHELL